MFLHLISAFEKAGNGVEDGIEEKPQNNEVQKKEPMKVVLRIKPFTEKDLKSQENRGKIIITILFLISCLRLLLN